MNRFKISRQADRDLEDMWVYLAQNDSLAADLLLAKAFDKFPMLAQFPEMGRSRKELSEELRSFQLSHTLSSTKEWNITLKLCVFCISLEILKISFNAWLEVKRLF